MDRNSKTIRALMITAIGGLAIVASAAVSADDHGAAKKDAAKQNIVEIAVGTDSFETLVAALQAAGLVETLQGKGPFTVFAPTDEAFAKLPAGTLDALLADKAKLTAVLTYHVVAGELMAADVAKATSAVTVQGGTLAIDTSNGVRVGAAQVVQTDIVASNGVIHVIDTVLVP
jgi:uncharacterized surface protein with fasciclin (FAS1) repeats